MKRRVEALSRPRRSRGKGGAHRVGADVSKGYAVAMLPTMLEDDRTRVGWSVGYGGVVLSTRSRNQLASTRCPAQPQRPSRRRL